MPKRQASLPRYLEESECERLLEACEGKFEYRDYAILMLFLSCGLRVSELVSLNLTDVYDDHVRVIGKGNKERVVFFADGCREALDDCLAVRDTGIGLTKEEARMVFSRFWRADAGRNRESGGLGVGLAVVKEIVDRHGGWVQVEGEKGKGACFTIHIPLYDEDASKHRRNSKKRTGHKKPAKASR